MGVFYCIWFAMSLILENDQNHLMDHKRSFARIMVPMEILEEKMALQGMAFLFDYLGTPSFPQHKWGWILSSPFLFCFRLDYLNKTKPCYSFCLKTTWILSTKAWCSIRPPFHLTSAFHGKPSSPGPRDAHSTGVRPGCGISPPRDHCRYLSHESRTQVLNPRISGHYHRIAVKLKEKNIKKRHKLGLVATVFGFAKVAQLSLLFWSFALCIHKIPQMADTQVLIRFNECERSDSSCIIPSKCA